MPVYFIQDVEQGYIKIGQSKNPEGRLRELQTGNPNKLKLLWVDRAGEYTEEELHQEFCEHRLNGEWFYPADELISTVRTSVWSRKLDTQVYDYTIDEDGRGRIGISALGMSILIDPENDSVIVTDNTGKRRFNSKTWETEDLVGHYSPEIEF